MTASVDQFASGFVVCAVSRFHFCIPRAEPVTWFVRAKVLVCRALSESDGLDSCWFCLSSCV